MFDVARILAVAFVLVRAWRTRDAMLRVLALATAACLVGELSLPFVFPSDRHDAPFIALGFYVLGTSALPVRSYAPGDWLAALHYAPLLLVGVSGGALAQRRSHFLPHHSPEKPRFDGVVLAFAALCVMQGLLCVSALLAVRFVGD